MRFPRRAAAERPAVVRRRDEPGVPGLEGGSHRPGPEAFAAARIASPPARKTLGASSGITLTVFATSIWRRCKVTRGRSGAWRSAPMARSSPRPRLRSDRPNEVILWNVADARQIQRFEVPGGLPRRIEFSPDGKRLALAVGDPGLPGEIQIWDVARVHLE